MGIGALLTEGIGDTIRVSLSEEPECEIPVARKLVELIPECTRLRQEAEASIKDDTIFLTLDAADLETLQLKAAMAVGALLIDRKATKLVLSPNLGDLSDAILQAARIKFTKTEYISCPGCGRTLYNLQDTIRRIKEAIKQEQSELALIAEQERLRVGDRRSGMRLRMGERSSEMPTRLEEVNAAIDHLKGLKIGIMGCIVNGPGEMADADYGYVGAGRGKISLYRGKECVEKNIPEAEAVTRLLALIKGDK